jgi:hypothetical protein
MSRVRQYAVATATFSVALGIGFVMQNGDALASRFSETPTPAMPQVAEAAIPAAVTMPSPDLRDTAAAIMVQQRINGGITESMRLAVVTAPSARDMAAVAAPMAEPALTAPTAIPEAVSFVPDVSAVVPRVDAPPVLEVALEADPVPPVPMPELQLQEPACDIALRAEVLPAALVALSLDSPCSPSAQVTIHHQGMQFSVVTDDAGQMRIVVPALAEGAVFMADLGDAGGAVAVVTVPDLNEYDRAVLQWSGAAGPEIHALEFGAGYGEAGHVWHGAPRSADAAIDGSGGFLVRLGDGEGLNPQMAEVYTYPSAGSRMSGLVEFSVETPVTEETCGRDLAAQTIQVSPGAEPFAFDLTMAVPDCDYTGELLILRDVLLDLTLVAQR